MDDMTAWMEQTLLGTQDKHLADSFRTVAVQFRSGDDAAGIQGLLTAASELDNQVKTDLKSQQPQISLSCLLPFLRELYFYIHNQDITGIADFLEQRHSPPPFRWGLPIEKAVSSTTAKTTD